MPESAIRLYRAVPGPASLIPLIKRFCRDGEGLVSSFDDSTLPTLKEIVGVEDDVSVISFGALVKRMLEASGQVAGMIATKTQHIAALGQAAAVLEDDSRLRKSLRFQGTREVVGDLLSEFHNWGIDLESLIEDDQLSEPLRKKLGELHLLERRTGTLLELIGRTLASQQMNECFDSFLDPELRPQRVMLLIGSDAPPAKVKWARWLAGQGADLTLVAPRHATDSAFYPQIDRLAYELGCQEEPIGGGNMLTERLFTQSPSTAVKIEGSKHKSANATSECEWAIQEASQGDAVIYVRDLQMYAPLLESASRRCGIPVRLQRRVKLTENAFAQLTMACLDACSRNDVRLFVPLLRRSYLRVSKDARNHLESLIASARADRAGQWDLLEAGGSGGHAEADWFEKLIALRKELLGEPHPLGWWVAKLQEFVDILPWQDSIDGAENYDSRRDERAIHVMQTSINTEARLESFGDQPRLYNFRQFAVRCRALWETADVSVPDRDGIPVVTASSAIPPARKVIVLGMLEGVFPRRRREDPILSDQERQEISAILPDRRPLATSRELSTEDRQEFYSICAAATDQLCLSYPVTADDKDNIPTFYIDRVAEALGGLLEVDHLKASISSEVIPGDLFGISRQPALLLELGGSPLARDKSLPVKPSELRDAVSCPFKFQMRHTIKLDPGSRRTAWYRLRYLPEDARLLSAPSEEAADKLLRNSLQKELDRLVPDLSEWELKLIKGGGERLILDWVRREFLARKIWPKTPEAYGERAIGGSGLKELMPGEVKLAAKVSGISHLSPRSKVIHLFESNAPSSNTLSAEEQLYYGIYFLASFEPGFESLIEVDGIDGSRSLLFFDRNLLPPLQNRNQENVRTLDLSGDVNAGDAKKEFYKGVRENLKRAAAVIQYGEFQATPGPQQCAWCDFGELCRKSALYVKTEEGEESNG